MEISCNSLKECINTHEKVSWHRKNEEIPFDGNITRDRHFKRESIENIHRLWIDKTYPSDGGLYCVRKQKEEKQCELEVLGKISYV